MMREYKVTITETSEMIATVEAESRGEAQWIALDNRKNGDYIPDADHFKDMTLRTKSWDRDRDER